MKPSYYRFSAIFTQYDGGVSVVFPDLAGCVSHGADMDEAAENAKTCLALHLNGMEVDGDVIPYPVGAEDLTLGEGKTARVVTAYMPPIRERAGAADLAAV